MKTLLAKDKVYIAGPMSGFPNFNFDAFDAAAKRLEARGVEVENPAVRGREWVAANEGREMTEEEYLQILRRGFESLRECNAIYLLRGWEQSRGAKEELSFALIKGIKVELEVA